MKNNIFFSPSSIRKILIILTSLSILTILIYGSYRNIKIKKEIKIAQKVFEEKERNKKEQNEQQEKENRKNEAKKKQIEQEKKDELEEAKRQELIVEEDEFTELPVEENTEIIIDSWGEDDDEADWQDE